MLYTSTRNNTLRVEASEAITRGISEDGGLFVPESFPRLSDDELRGLLPLSYQERAKRIFAKYLTDYKSSYGQFDLVDVLRQCGKQFVPKWRDRLGRLRERENKLSEGFCEVGIAALYTYLRREYVAKGIDIRTSPVVLLSSLTEKDLKFIESGEPLLL